MAATGVVDEPDGLNVVVDVDHNSGRSRAAAP